jgi:hypothetical protein
MSWLKLLSIMIHSKQILFLPRSKKQSNRRPKPKRIMDMAFKRNNVDTSLVSEMENSSSSLPQRSTESCSDHSSKFNKGDNSCNSRQEFCKKVEFDFVGKVKLKQHEKKSFQKSTINTDGFLWMRKWNKQDRSKKIYYSCTGMENGEKCSAVKTFYRNFGNSEWIVEYVSAHSGANDIVNYGEGDTDKPEEQNQEHDKQTNDNRQEFANETLNSTNLQDMDGGHEEHERKGKNPSMRNTVDEKELSFDANDLFNSSDIEFPETENSSKDNDDRREDASEGKETENPSVLSSKKDETGDKHEDMAMDELFNNSGIECPENDNSTDDSIEEDNEKDAAPEMLINRDVKAHKNETARECNDVVNDVSEKSVSDEVDENHKSAEVDNGTISFVINRKPVTFGRFQIVIF